MEYKWKTLSVTAVGTIMSAIDSTIVILAIFPIAKDIHTDFITMVWVVIAYLLINTSFVLSLGRISDIYGRKKLYNIGFVVFIIGSGLSGLSINGSMLIMSRSIQGIGAALLTANSFAILSEAFSGKSLGKAFGINSIIWGIGSVLGIILGGVIITYTSWRWIFLINVPIGILGTIWAYKTLRESVNKTKKRAFDLTGAILFTTGLLSILMGITYGMLYGWSNPVTLILIIISPFLFSFWFLWEKSYKDPIISFYLFKNRAFSYSLITAFIQSLALFSVNFLLIFYLEGIMGLSVLKAAYLIVPMAIVTSIVGPFAGILSDKIGARVVATFGLLIQTSVLLLLIGLTTTTTLLTISVIEALYGFGSGLFWPANTSIIMSSSREYGVVSGVMNSFRNTGMIMSFVLAIIAVSSQIPSYIVYELFVGNINGKLPSALSSSYLIGQGFAFTVAMILLMIATLFSILGFEKQKVNT